MSDPPDLDGLRPGRLTALLDDLQVAEAHEGGGGNLIFESRSSETHTESSTIPISGESSPSTIKSEA